MYTIVLEGTDGSGKSTQAKLLMKYLAEKGFQVLSFREPRVMRDEIHQYSEKIGHEEGYTDEFLSYLYGLDGYKDREEEALAAADLSFKPGVQISRMVTVRDRDTTISQYAYHHGLGTSDTMVYLMSWFLNAISETDIVLFVDVPAEESAKRLAGRSDKAPWNYYEKEDKLRKIRENYLKILQEPELRKLLGLEKVRFHRIDGLGTQEEVFARVKNVIDNFLEDVHAPKAE